MEEALAACRERVPPPDYTFLAITKAYGSRVTASDGTIGTPNICERCRQAILIAVHRPDRSDGRGALDGQHDGATARLDDVSAGQRRDLARHGHFQGCSDRQVLDDLLKTVGEPCTDERPVLLMPFNDEQMMTVGLGDGLVSVGPTWFDDAQSTRASATPGAPALRQPTSLPVARGGSHHSLPRGRMRRGEAAIRVGPLALVRRDGFDTLVGDGNHRPAWRCA